METTEKLLSKLQNLLSWHFPDKILELLNPQSKYGKTSVEKYLRKIKSLESEIAGELGEYTVIDGERKYGIDEDQHRFESKRHRNLGGILLQELRAAGLDAERTADRDPRGDILYTKTNSETLRSFGQKSFDFLGDFAREIYDAGLLKIATFETVDIGKINDEYYRSECKLWNASVDPEELCGSYEERVIVLTDIVRVFLVAFLSAKIAKEATSFAADIKNITIEQVTLQSQWLGRLGALLEAVQDKKYRFLKIE